MTSKTEYLGNLRVKSTHLKSGSSFLTDAPTDNHGKGEAFSPTDTVATALGSCMLTTMGIKDESKEVNLVGAYVEITKTMAANPRRISRIDALVHFPENYPDKTKKILERIAWTCPVRESLHPDIEIVMSFKYEGA